MIKYLKDNSITETSNLIRASSVMVAEWIGLRKAEHWKKNELRWKHMIRGGYIETETRGQLSGKGIKGELGLKKNRKLSELNERYRLKRKRLKAVIGKLKQRMLAKSANVRRYEQRFEQFRQKRILESLILIRKRCTQNSIESR